MLYVDHLENLIITIKVGGVNIYISVQRALLHLGCVAENFTHFLKVCKEIQNVILL